MFENKTIKVVAWVSFTILLGAIGSGLWDRFISPSSDFLFSLIAKFLASVSTSYLNSLYIGIGNNDKQQFSIFIYSIVICLMLFFPWFLNLSLFKEYKKVLTQISKLRSKIEGSDEKDKEIHLDVLKSEMDQEEIRLKKWFRRFNYVIILLSIMLTVLIIASAAGHIYQYKAILYVERSIEILAPKISSEKYLQLRAQFRSIDCKDKFIDLGNELLRLSKELKVELPKFKVIE